jgi:hypothetical protein
MERLFDEFAKSLAASVPRRESLRRLGALFAGAALSPLGLSTAWAGGGDPCKAFCRRCSRGSDQYQCLAACRACNKDTSRLCGSCGSYACCGAAETCCAGSCADLASNFDHCGACGFACEDPDPYEVGACMGGACVYWCADGAIVCNDRCTPVAWDPDNCGACGHVCAEPTPFCSQGECSACYPGLTDCGGYCAYLNEDPANCGACGNVCPPYTSCLGGFCQPNDPPPDGP